MNIRSVQEEEFQVISELLMNMGKVETQGLQERFIETVQNPSYLFIGVFRGGQALGYAIAQDYGFHLRLGKKTCRLHDLYVLPEYRKEGLARQLMEATFDWCKSVNATWLQWNASKESIQFYERIGCKSIKYDEETPEFEIEFTKR
ncbi:GNAT family N-acetyltransferase [Planococcus dechangensis]|uniref:GNAT family N-acetyltransferase n=1 Tax=Planococcus dechangensis TaxID=1176255 RepID=A0ABV9MA54_9BACL